MSAVKKIFTLRVRFATARCELRRTCNLELRVENTGRMLLFKQRVMSRASPIQTRSIAIARERGS